MFSCSTPSFCVKKDSIRLMLEPTSPMFSPFSRSRFFHIFFSVSAVWWTFPSALPKELVVEIAYLALLCHASRWEEHTFPPYLGKIPFWLYNKFQMGWNHQLLLYSRPFSSNASMFDHLLFSTHHKWLAKTPLESRIMDRWRFGWFDFLTFLCAQFFLHRKLQKQLFSNNKIGGKCLNE